MTKKEVRKQPPKFEELLTQEEIAKKEAKLKLRELQQLQKQTNQNDFKAAMSMGSILCDQEDTKKKLTKAAARSKREAFEGTQMNSKQKKAYPQPGQMKDKFASMYD